VYFNIRPDCQDDDDQSHGDGSPANFRNVVRMAYLSRRMASVPNSSGR
jgi:hypothetical protein